MQSGDLALNAMAPFIGVIMEIVSFFGEDLEPVPQDHSKVWVSFGHAVVGLASYWQLYLWTGRERGLAMDRAGKRHLLRHVWFEE